MNKTTYWKRTHIEYPDIVLLYKVENDGQGLKGYIFKKGKWVGHPTIAAKAGYDADYDCITEAEAKSIIKSMS